MLKRNLLLPTAAACLLAAVPALAQPGPPGPGGWHHAGLLDGVTLSDQQKTSLHTLMEADHASSHDLFKQMMAIHEQIDTALLSSGTVTATTLAPLVQQQESLQQEMDAKRVTEELAIRSLLTPAQLSQASTAHAQLVALHQQEEALRQTGDTPPQ